MRTALYLLLLGLLLLPLRAEDWTTSDGKTYHNVQVLSSNAAYVTILHEDGGGRVPISTLSPDLQKRFAYDPAKAASVVAATKTADQQDKTALAAEKQKTQALQAQREQEAAAILANSLFGPPPDSALFAQNAPSPADEDAYRPIASEPPTQIDDWDYSDYGDSGYYGGYGYYPSGYGYGRGNRGYSHNYHHGVISSTGMHSFTHH